MQQTEQTSQDFSFMEDLDDSLLDEFINENMDTFVDIKPSPATTVNLTQIALCSNKELILPSEYYLLVDDIIDKEKEIWYWTLVAKMHYNEDLYICRTMNYNPKWLNFYENYITNLLGKNILKLMERPLWEAALILYQRNYNNDIYYVDENFFTIYNKNERILFLQNYNPKSKEIYKMFLYKQVDMFDNHNMHLSYHIPQILKLRVYFKPSDFIQYVTKEFVMEVIKFKVL